MKTKNKKVIHYTVLQLINELKKFPQDLPIFVSGYEDGFENIIKPTKIKLEHKADNPYWDGEFQENDMSIKNSMEAVVLRRVMRDT